ncbi:hypothetical protein EJB05_48750, partial [Eragrostis curvula]
VKLWLFVTFDLYFICLGLAGAVGLLVLDPLTDKGPSCGLVFACVMQCPCDHHPSALIYWTCHSEDG